MNVEGKRGTEALVSEGRALAPWHLAVEVTEDISTRDFADAPYPESFGYIDLLDPRDRFAATLSKLYPDGLAGRTVLDCGCNCGGYLFWAKDLGAGHCHGIDVREHWIKQAHFLSANRTFPSDDMRFEALDLYDLPAKELTPFDLVLFNGIFYHLPDPIAGLKVAAELSRELLIINTSTTIDLPDGHLTGSGESLTRGVSGVYGLNWFPTGPEVLMRILAWLGFPEARVNWWRRFPGQAQGHGRLEVVAAREPRALAHFDAVEQELPPLSRIVEKTVPPEATVLVLGAPEETPAVEFDGRQAVPFPGHRMGAADDAALIAELVRRRGEGAACVLFPRVATTWLSEHPDLMTHIFKRYKRVAREEGVGVLFSLLPSWPPR
jgi:tRNA (mo5U34)-methyltransferase